MLYRGRLAVGWEERGKHSELVFSEEEDKTNQFLPSALEDWKEA